MHSLSLRGFDQQTANPLATMRRRDEKVMHFHAPRAEMKPCAG